MRAYSISLRLLAKLLLGAGGLCALIGAPAAAQTALKTSPVTAVSGATSGLINWSLGSPTAPVTVLEYASLTCGHCEAFHTNVLPAIKRRFINTGRIRYILRPLPTPPFELSVAMHALTMCAGPSRYYPLIDAFFQRQRDIFTAAGSETGPKGVIFAIAEDVGGLSYAASEACLSNPARQSQVRTNAESGVALGVRATPTVFVNNVLVTVPAGQTLTEERLAEAIMAAERSRATQPKVKAKKR